MKPASDDNPVVLPPALWEELESAALEDHRPVADMLRDLIERGLGSRRGQVQAEREQQQANQLGLRDADLPMSDAYRQVIHEKISAGMTSARQGRLVDGPAVFARIYAELDELERQQGQR